MLIFCLSALDNSAFLSSYHDGDSRLTEFLRVSCLGINEVRLHGLDCFPVYQNI